MGLAPREPAAYTRTRLEEGESMQDKTQKALNFAVAKEREAEAFYKEWAQKAKDPAVKALFAELAATEHGHAEILSRITRDEMIARGSAPVDEIGLAELLADVRATAKMGLQEAMILAMKREEVSVALYERLADFGGVAEPLLRALAREERRHKQRLETEYDEQILTEN